MSTVLLTVQVLWEKFLDHYYLIATITIWGLAVLFAGLLVYDLWLA